MEIPRKGDKQGSLKVVLVLQTTKDDLEAMKEYVAKTTSIRILFMREGLIDSYFLIKELSDSGVDRYGE
jgi:hypothetical protein